MPNGPTELNVETSNPSPPRPWSQPRLTVLDCEDTKSGKTTSSPVERDTTTGPPS
jgi:hypothetical protein